MTLVNLTPEEKAERKKQQKKEAQHRYYEKNKDKYKEYSKRYIKKKSERDMKELETHLNIAREQNLQLLKVACHTEIANLDLRITNKMLKNILNCEIVGIIVFSMYMMIVSVSKIYIENKKVLGWFMLLCWTASMLGQVHLLFNLNKKNKKANKKNKKEVKADEDNKE